jgi:ATP-dependent Clp protease adaptor protein ClpS
MSVEAALRKACMPGVCATGVPATVPAREAAGAAQGALRLAPLYNVVLLDDDDHTYHYVVHMLCTLFEVGFEMAYLMACAVDKDGRVIVCTTDRDTARRKRDQISSFGPDPLLPHSTGSMGAVIEPVPSA